MTGLPKTLLAACIVSSATLVVATAHAADASAWAQDRQSAFRLIAGRNAERATPLRAGIEIKLQPGWKTYWRYPGDAGIPPRFDFSGSDNLARAQVLYPAPHLFSDESGSYLGYKGDVVLPLRVTPRQPGKPVKLRVKLDYAVCEKLCIPAEGQAELTLAGGDSALDASLAASEAEVPKPAPAAAIGLAAKRVNGGRKPLVFVDLVARDGEKIDLFVEGPTAEWALPIPKPAQGAPAGHRHFAFELDGLPPGVDPRGPFELTFTVVGAGRALEIKSRLDE